MEYCNIVTPTCQNLNSMELDIRRLVDFLLAGENMGQGITEGDSTLQDKIVMEIEKLIRAYDPCFSCSTHFLRVDWL